MMGGVRFVAAVGFRRISIIIDRYYHKFNASRLAAEQKNSV